MNIFILLIIVFIIGIFLCFVPSIEKFLCCIFESSRFRAIRFVVIIFGVIGAILGFTKWYFNTNQRVITHETTFQIFEPSLGNNIKDKTEMHMLAGALNDYFFNCMTRPFIAGWKPVFVTIDERNNRMGDSFKDDKGELVTLKEIQNKIGKYLGDNTLAPNIYQFYIPPKCKIEFDVKKENEKYWVIIDIDNDEINLKTSITVLGSICYIKTEYKKKKYLGIIFDKYNDYDRWYNIFVSELDLIQEKNRSIINSLRKMKK